MMRRLCLPLLCCVASVALAAIAAPASARDLTIQDVVGLSRVGAPAVSPDGHWLVWQQRETDLAANKGRYDLWRLDLTAKGARPEKLVAEPLVNETAPQFSADGKTVWFQSNKDDENTV
jgi:Tol biopolymer transport system component